MLNHDVISIIGFSILFKVATTAVFLASECLLARYLKIKEKINVFNYNVKHDIFRFKLGDENKPSLILVK
jgi:hypothetical protein